MSVCVHACVHKRENEKGEKKQIKMFIHHLKKSSIGTIRKIHLALRCGQLGERMGRIEKEKRK